jgi:hypothetical protein
VSTTVRDVATRALRLLGVLGPSEVPDAGQSAIALETLNDWLDQGKADRPRIYTVARDTSTLTPSQASFTVGTGGNIAIARPVFLDRVAYVDNSVSPALEIPLGRLLTDVEYQAIPNKALTSTRPQAAYYRPDFPLGVLIPWPISTGASLLWAIYHPVAVDEFATINDTVTLPPGYRLMLITKLAIMMSPIFSRQVTRELARMAYDAEAIVARANEREQSTMFPAEALFGSGGGHFNILTGQ